MASVYLLDHADQPVVTRVTDVCHVCGGRSFEHTPILWPALIAAWGLSAEEAEYIDVQQGTHCLACSANVRSMALARAILRFRDFAGTLTELVADRGQHALRVLEINEAGSLNPVLRQLPGHQLASYPAVDMRHLPYSSAAFDLVVHSDTLEHVPEPERALTECRRVLTDQGALAFTVPVIINRLSRSRAGLPPSYHGHEESLDPGMLVQTEFGADVWVWVMRAGFSSSELVWYRPPSGLAILARP
jgi:SAM-dependent methyltransferase